MRRAFILPIILLLTACAPAVPVPPSASAVPPTETPVPTAASTFTLTTTSTPTSTPEPAATLTHTPTDTLTPTYTSTPTLTPEPTYVVLRGVVNQEHVNCYYGPSKAYLYKYGLLKGNRLDIIGYLADTGYIEVQAIGGDNPCWMNLEFMDVQGDIQAVQPVDPTTVRLPWSRYYSGLEFAKAERSGNEVTVTWSPLALRAGDESEQEPYLLEIWVCREGRRVFVPVGAYTNQATVQDEPGCSESSSGRVYGVEKHGYTKYLMFTWPQAEGSSN